MLAFVTFVNAGTTALGGVQNSQVTARTGLAKQPGTIACVTAAQQLTTSYLVIRAMTHRKTAMYARNRQAHCVWLFHRG
jgi:hypothetical protein